MKSKHKNGIDYDQEYMTNVSNNLVKEVDNVLSNEKKELEEKQEEKKYFGYESRLLFNILIFAFVLLSGLGLIFVHLQTNYSKEVKYSETSELDYNVYLKENKIFDKKILQKDMLYVSNIINKIDVDFNYVISLNEELKNKYRIYGLFQITDKSGNVYLEKEVDYINSETSNNSINDKFSIKYDDYKDILVALKEKNKDEVVGNLDVFLSTTKEFKSDTVTSKNNYLIMQIPISEKDDSIKIQYKNINTSSSYIKNDRYTAFGILTLVFGIILIIISLLFVYNFIYYILLLKERKSNYDKFIEHILSKYDNIIVTHKTKRDFNMYNVIKLANFKELLDLHYNTKEPIMYYNVIKHIKDNFYIIIDNDVYLYTSKSVDVEK